MLGLLALGWALLVAPVLHRETHSHGTSHSHGPSSNQKHGDGSLEHQALAFTQAPALVSFDVVAVPVELSLALEPKPVMLAAVRRVENSQAP